MNVSSEPKIPLVIGPAKALLVNRTQAPATSATVKFLMVRLLISGACRRRINLPDRNSF